MTPNLQKVWIHTLLEPKQTQWLCEEMIFIGGSVDPENPSSAFVFDTTHITDPDDVFELLLDIVHRLSTTGCRGHLKTSGPNNAGMESIAVLENQILMTRHCGQSRWHILDDTNTGVPTTPEQTQHIDAHLQAVCDDKSKSLARSQHDLILFRAQPKKDDSAFHPWLHR